jgi:hypothetical protein
MIKEVEKPKDQIPVFFLSGFFSMLLISGVADGIIFNPNVNSYVSLLAGVFSLVLFMVVLKKTMPRCPNCTQGIYSVIELKGYPLVLKSWSGKNCWGCGAKYKT